MDLSSILTFYLERIILSLLDLNLSSVSLNVDN